MSVTLEGVFRIIDRASPAMRGMEIQALKTDAAIASVGASLDALGSKKQQQNLDSTTRSVRTLGTEADNTSKRTASAADSLESMDSKVKKVGSSTDGLVVKWKKLTILLTPLKFLAIGSAIGVVVQALGAMAGGVIALVPRLSDLVGLAAPAVAGITGIGVAAIATKLALSDLTKAYAGNKAALKALTPEGKAFLAQLKAMKPTIAEFRASAQQGLFPGLEASLRRVKSAAPTINTILKRGGASAGNAVKRITTNLTQPATLQDINSLSAQGAQVVSSGTSTLLSLLDVLRNFAVSAEPFTNWLTHSIQLWAAHRAAISQFNRDSGKTAAFLDRTRQSATLLENIVSNLWGTLRNLGQDARPLGNDLWQGIDKATARWKALTDTVGSREGLTKEFLEMEPALKAIVRLFGDLGAAIFQMGSNQGLPTTVNALNGLVPSLEKTLDLLANTFGPPLANMLSSIGNLATALSGAAGPFALMANLLAKTFDFITDITNAVPGMGKVLGTALDVFLISRFLVKLGLLEKGWLGVASAAGKAAVASDAAMGGAGAGVAGVPILGRLRGKVASSGFGFGFAARRGGAATAADAAEVGGMTGLGIRAAGALGTIGRVSTPLGIGIGAAGLGAQFLPLPASVKSTGMDAAEGAGVGFMVGGPLGAGIGGLAGLGLGLVQNTGMGDLKAKAASGFVNSQMGQLGQFPTQIAKLTAELAIYQNAQRILQGDHSKEAQAELQSIQQEIAARKSVVNQLKAEKAERIAASQMSQARNIATDLGHLFDFVNKQTGSKGKALKDVDTTSRADLRRLTGAAQLQLAQALLKFNTHAAKVDPSLAGINASERKFIGQLVPGAMPITATARKFSGTVAEGNAIRAQFNAQHHTEVARQKASQSRTELQNTAYRYFLALGFTETQATALVQAADGTGRMPAVPTGTSPQGKPSAAAQFSATLSPFAPGPLKNPLAPTLFTTTHAGGGRIPGGGLSDTVPIGGGAMAAPGELIVNRHQERAADHALGKNGSLAGIVHGLPVKHSSFMSGFAQGGRVNPVSLAESFIGTPYVFGGESPEGFDCSGLLQYVFAKAGVSIPRTTYQQFQTGKPVGRGALRSGDAVFFTGSDPMNGLPGHVGLYMGGGKVIEAPHTGSTVQVASLAAMSAQDGYRGAREYGGISMGKAAAGMAGKLVGSQAKPQPSASNVLSALAFAGNAFATGQEAIRAQAAASIMGFVASAAGGGAVGSTSGGGTTARGKAGKRSLSSAAPVSGSAGSFASALAAATGLSPTVTAAWVRAENNGGGPNNWLNVSAGSGGKGYSGVAEIAGKGQFAGFSSPASALTETAYWINQMSNYAGIKSAAGGSPQSQIDAIMASPWDAGHYSNGSLHLARGGRVPYAGAFQDGGQFKTNGPTMFMAGDGHSPKETVTVTKGHGGGSMVVEHMEVNVTGPEHVKAATLEALEEAFEEFGRHLEREATK